MCVFLCAKLKIYKELYIVKRNFQKITLIDEISHFKRETVFDKEPVVKEIVW